MSTIKHSQFTEATSLTGAKVVIVQSGANKIAPISLFNTVVDGITVDATGITINTDGDIYLKTSGNTRIKISSEGIINFSGIQNTSEGLSLGDIYRDGDYIKIVI
jgi:hypothetical protein